MRFHKNLVDAVVLALMQIFSEGKYADKVIEKVLQSDKRWGARDRAFIAENTYEIVRWWRLLRYLTHSENETLTSASLYKIIGTWQILNEIELPRWEEFAEVKPFEVEKLYQKAEKIRKIRQSVPDWLDELGETEVGENWDKELTALNQEAPVILRANALKTSAHALRKLFQEKEIETFTIDTLPDALMLKKRMNVFTSDYFKEGLFEVQDAASQLVAPFLETEPGMRVVDACAGAGGKTLHLASIMENKGRIIAMDVEQWKLDELKKRARRNGVQNMETRLIENNKTIKRLYDTADRLLLDVPCSGLGVLRRNPDAKWKLDLDFINQIRKTQQEILQNYSQMLRKGGKLVYATCSILPSESEEQVKKFLAQNTDFTLLDENRISPAETGFDGFYMARMERK
jgi:16S rRNA (cytosine967-C5)-methyltransferase